MASVCGKHCPQYLSIGGRVFHYFYIKSIKNGYRTMQDPKDYKLMIKNIQTKQNKKR